MLGLPIDTVLALTAMILLPVLAAILAVIDERRLGGYVSIFGRPTHRGTKS